MGQVAGDESQVAGRKAGEEGQRTSTAGQGAADGSQDARTKKTGEVGRARADVRECQGPARKEEGVPEGAREEEEVV